MDMHCLFVCTKRNELRNEKGEKGNNTCVVVVVAIKIWKGTRMVNKTVYFIKKLLLTLFKLYL